MTSAKKYVTADIFSEDKVVFKDIVKRSAPVPFQRIPIQYIYDDGEEGPLVIKTHKMFSFGVLENKDVKTGKIQGYSFPFVTGEEDDKFINMLEKITSMCRKCVQQKMENGRKTIDVDSLVILKTKEEYTPAMFVKIRTKYDHKPLTIETPFKKLAGKKMVDINPLSMVRKKCEAIGAVQIDNIFIGCSIMSIQIKLNELLVVKEIERESVFEDIDIEDDL